MQLCLLEIVLMNHSCYGKHVFMETECSLISFIAIENNTEHSLHIGMGNPNKKAT